MDAADFCLSFIVAAIGFAFPIIISVQSQIEEKYTTESLTKLFREDWRYKYFTLLAYFSAGPVALYFLKLPAPISCLIYSATYILYAFSVVLGVFMFFTLKQCIEYSDSEWVFEMVTKRENRIDYILVLTSTAKKYDDHVLMGKVIAFISKEASEFRNQKKDFFSLYYWQTRRVFDEVIYGRNSLYTYHQLPVHEHILNVPDETAYSQGEWLYLWYIVWSSIEKSNDESILTLWNQLHGKVRKFPSSSATYNANQLDIVKFSVTILSLLWFRNNYSLIKRLLKFSLASPGGHETLPNSMSSVLEILYDFKNDLDIDKFVVMLRFPDDEGLNWVYKGNHVQKFLQVYIFHFYELYHRSWNDRFDYFNFEPNTTYNLEHVMKSFVFGVEESFKNGEVAKIIDPFYLGDFNVKQMHADSPETLIQKLKDKFGTVDFSTK